MGSWYDFISQYGYIAIFCLLTLGIIGLPIPDEILLTYLGYITSIDQMVFSYTFLAAFLGSVCGITVNYFLGVKLGEPFIRKYGRRFFISERRLERTRKMFARYGPMILFLCYFVPGVRHVAAYFAGTLRFKYRKFALYTYASAVVWVLVFITLGNRLGANWEVIIFYFYKYMWLMIVLILLFISWFIVRKRNRSRSFF